MAITVARSAEAGRDAPPTLAAVAEAWFESVAVAQRRAKRRLPRSLYLQLVGGSERVQSMQDNEAAFTELGIRPVTAGQSARIEEFFDRTRVQSNPSTFLTRLKVGETLAL